MKTGDGFRRVLPMIVQAMRSYEMKSKSTVPPAVRAYLALIGRKGGKSTSPAKLAAIAKNAKKGGWPKGRPRKTK